MEEIDAKWRLAEAEANDAKRSALEACVRRAAALDAANEATRRSAAADADLSRLLAATATAAAASAMVDRLRVRVREQRHAIKRRRAVDVQAAVDAAFDVAPFAELERLVRGKVDTQEPDEAPLERPDEGFDAALVLTTLTDASLPIFLRDHLVRQGNLESAVLARQAWLAVAPELRARLSWWPDVVFHSSPRSSVSEASFSPRFHY